VRVRKRVSSSAGQTDLAVYAEGVKLMKERSQADPLDPLGWYYQSRMHGNPFATPRRPDEPEDWSQCQHGTWFFLPWHRMYLLQFERIIATLTETPEFALPYWDYPSASQIAIPPEFLDETSPLYDEDRDFDQPLVEPPVWQDEDAFLRFGGGESRIPVHRGRTPGFLELNPHNPVHGAVAGDMATFQSPLDPLFWIHHCNIDRLWDVWLRKPGRANPASTSWSGTSFEFPDPVEGRRTSLVSAVATTSAAGYEYDDAPAPAVDEGDFELAGPRRPKEKLELLGSAPGGSVAESHMVRLESRLAADDSAGLVEEAPPQVFLRLENTGVRDADASQMWNVFVRARDEEWGLAGTIAPFGLAGLTQSGGRQNYTFDISHLGPALAEQGASVEVKFEPARRGVTAEPFFERVSVYTSRE
jgi:tyrosinase